jgi:DNA-binding IclR family transcriptional regulator
MEILNGIKTTEDCTLSKLYRKTRLKKSYIDKVLVLMISWGVIDMRISPAGTHYHLVDQENS